MLEFSEPAIHETIKFGSFNIVAAKNIQTNKEHVMLYIGDVGNGVVSTRISSACTTGNALFSNACDCKSQNEFALETIREREVGVLIYLDQEGRGHGLFNKVRALRNKNRGMDTFAAVEQLGLESDIREYADVLPMLEHIGVRTVHLLTSNPDKIRIFEGSEVTISGRSSLKVANFPNWERHLKAKRARGFYD